MIKLGILRSKNLWLYRILIASAVLFAVYTTGTLIRKAYRSYQIRFVLPDTMQTAQKINLASLSPLLRGMFATSNLPLFWALVQINEGQAAFYTNVNNSHWAAKLAPLIDAFNAFHAQNSVPDGNYLISLMDGVHISYPWPVLGFASDQQLVDKGKVVLLPDFDALQGYSSLFAEVESGKRAYPWASKSAKIYWRGSATGLDNKVDPKSTFPRRKFMESVRAMSNVDAGFTAYSYELRDEKNIEYLETNFPLVPRATPAESLAFKYLIDIDGHSCSYSRMAWIMYSNSLLLKHQTDKIQWYYDRLRPYANFVPIANDFSDLQAQFAWAEANPEKVQAIINNANELAQDVFNPTSIRQATGAAFLTYHKIVSALKQI